MFAQIESNAKSYDSETAKGYSEHMLEVQKGYQRTGAGTSQVPESRDVIRESSRRYNHDPSPANSEVLGTFNRTIESWWLEVLESIHRLSGKEKGTSARCHFLTVVVSRATSMGLWSWMRRVPRCGNRWIEGMSIRVQNDKEKITPDNGLKHRKQYFFYLN